MKSIITAMELRGKEVTEKKEESAALDGLPWDLLIDISRRLPAPRDRLSFRAVNRWLRSAMPSSLTNFFKEEQACFSDQPWLLSYCRKNNMDHDAYTLINPLHGDKYFMTLAGSGSGCGSSSDSGSGSGSHPTMIYCNDSWSLMVQATQSIFLWNPFTKEKIALPDVPHKWSSIAACALINSPPDLHLKLCVCDQTDGQLTVCIDIFEHGEWCSDIAFKLKPGREQEQPPSFQSTLCLSHGYFWLHDYHKGTVWALGRQQQYWFAETTWGCSTLLDYKRSYLVDCGTDILLVLRGVAAEDEDVQVFKLGSQLWLPVEHLDDFVLYISHFSSFSWPVTTPGEGNKIYFPSLYDGKLVYYSLQSKRYHCAGEGEPISTDTFQQRNEDQILSAWIQPKWF